MAHSYTPGLKVTERMKITKKRILPLKGDVVVKVGDKVEPDTVVARTDLPGTVEPLNVANILGVPPEDVEDCMVKKEGDPIEKGETIALNKSFFGLFKTEAKSKISGSIESISSVTGQVLLRGEPIPVEVKAYLQGEVVEIFETEGCAISTQGSFVQGIFGVGGETHGSVKIVVPDNTTVLEEKHIDDSCKDCVVVGGSMATAGSINKAISVGAAGIVAGGISDKDLREFLGYDIGVAITGNEDLGVTLVVTEGFGEIAMAQKTFDLLNEKEGIMACINGATQIRAGVIRPEVVIPLSGELHETGTEEVQLTEGLKVGSPIRVIRQPYFGKIGTVSGLPPALQQLDSESKARVLEVEFEPGEKAVIPRANVELIEG
ncbi:MAG: hypothetical protein GF310_06785 [candidate division Zixibacteria bacterium]|nr:hypothetical protein [candidate division Zixibacteria bacterium]